MTTRGLILGKFLPPHAGHLRLIRFASEMVDDLTVVVASLASESIPGELRHAWMRELAPNARVMHLKEELPSEPSEHPDFWSLWRAALLALLPAAPTHVFASEPYGAPLAEVLGAQFVPLHRPSSISDGPLPVSGTEIRRAPWQHWRHLPEVVRPHFLRRIHIKGPESAGKSMLAAQLAEHFETVWVPEYARTWLTRPGAPMEGDVATVTPADMPLIARGHRASARALERAASRRIFVDTDALATVLWSRALHGHVDAEVQRLADQERPDLTLLLEPDVPFVQDQVRYFPEQRRRFFDACASALRDAGRSFRVIGGTFPERFDAAVQAVEELPPPAPMP